MCCCLCVSVHAVTDVMGALLSFSSDDDSEDSLVLSRTSNTNDTGGTGSTDAASSLPTLLDLCSRAVGKHYTCAALESHDPPLDLSLIHI